ncbi:hypothetical protein SAMN05216355_10317 [Actinomyces ruminicola]|uniref:Uncharacterized protein n=1 Tax=Actinomyces ruminicola TaxID=332524 RepID=A0A1H0B0X6_9ACTO|nr:hypothetical protein SAMN05216355_10317 [Actinomyces ruminicola]
MIGIGEHHMVLLCAPSAAPVRAPVNAAVGATHEPGLWITATTQTTRTRPTK